MSLKIKFMSAISAFMLVLSMLLVGVLAATQTINLKGTVNFNVSDSTLYLKDMRIQTESTGQDSTADNFMPGFISGEIDINLGTISSSSGSVNIYFDFVNTTSTMYQASPTGGSGVTLSTSGMIAGSQVAIGDVTTADISGTIILTIQFTGSSSVDLDGISISFNEYSPYERVDADDNPDPNGDYLYFGYYPQTIKESDITVGSSPESNGYYLGSDGEYYAKVSANPFDSNYTFSDGTTIVSGTEYYFKVEPLRWRILDDAYGDGTALIVCDSIINAKSFQSQVKNNEDDGYNYVIDDSGEYILDKDGNKVYANNYEYSEIRAYLNNDFYNSAFSNGEQTIIVTTEVDNSLESAGVMSDQKYICNNTYDKAFLLSFAEIENYGLHPQHSGTFDFITSDYSRASGIIMEVDDQPLGVGFSYTRSPFGYEYGGNYGLDVIFVSGGTSGNYPANSNLVGLLPAMQIQL